MDINNLDEYISLVVDATVRAGILRQLEAFRSGFNQVSRFRWDICSFNCLVSSETFTNFDVNVCTSV